MIIIIPIMIFIMGILIIIIGKLRMNQPHLVVHPTDRKWVEKT